MLYAIIDEVLCKAELLLRCDRPIPKHLQKQLDAIEEFLNKDDPERAFAKYLDGLQDEIDHLEDVNFGDYL